MDEEICQGMKCSIVVPNREKCDLANLNSHLATARERLARYQAQAKAAS
jgi:hypothetical protein